jgi:hypothetical protein
MPSELAPGQLKSRHGFLRLPELPIAPVQLELAQFADVAARFAAREMSAAEPAPAEVTLPAPDASESQPQAAASGEATLAPAPELVPGASPDALIDYLETRRRESWSAAQKKDPDSGDAGAGAGGVADR